MLQVRSVDLLTVENGRSHRTFDYELMERPGGTNLVVRRGQPFQLMLNLNRRFNPQNDGLSFVFLVPGKLFPPAIICYANLTDLAAFFNNFMMNSPSIIMNYYFFELIFMN